MLPDMTTIQNFERRDVLTWHDGLLAFLAPGRVLVGVAVSAEQLVLLGGEGLVHQRVLAAGAVEAGLVPVPVLIGQVLQTQTQRQSGGAGGGGEGSSSAHCRGACANLGGRRSEGLEAVGIPGSGPPPTAQMSKARLLSLLHFGATV